MCMFFFLVERCFSSFLTYSSVLFSSVTQLRLTLCDPMDCRTPGFLIYHQFLELTHTYVHRVGDAIQPSHPLSPPSLPVLNLSQPSGSFLVSWLFTSGGQSSGASAAASVLPINIQGWFPLGLTHLISLRSKGVSKAFSSTTIKKHQFFNAQPALWSNSNHWTAREVPMFAFIGLKHSNFHEGLFFPQCLGSAGLVKSRWPPLAQSWG